MDSLVFIIVFSLMIIVQIVIVVLVSPFRYNVLAGDVCVKHLFFGISPKEIEVIKCGEKKIDVSNMKSMIVRGNSMKKYDIYDGQLVFLKLIPESDTGVVDGHPVLVLKNKYNKLIFCRFKLRKFVCYIDALDSVDWEKIYEDNSVYIDMTKEQFCDNMRQKANRVKNRNGKFILSETFRETEQKTDYSLHHAKYIYASAEYVA